MTNTFEQNLLLNIKVKDAGRHDYTLFSVDVGRRVLILDIRLEIAVHEQIWTCMNDDSRYPLSERPIIAVLVLVQKKLQDGTYECFCEVKFITLK